MTNKSNFVDVTDPIEGRLYGDLTADLVAASAVECRMADPNTPEGSKKLAEHCVVQKMLDAAYPDHRHLVAQDVVQRIRRNASVGTPAERRRLSGIGRRLNRSFDKETFEFIGQHMGEHLLLTLPVPPSRTRQGKRKAYLKHKRGLTKKRQTSNGKRPDLRNLSGFRLAEWLKKD